MNADEVVKSLRWCSENNEFVFANETMRDAAALIKSLTAELAASRRRERAAVADLQAFVEYPCGVCAHLQDQRFCYLNCQNHDRENHRAWQWRGPSDREAHHDA